jgi:hypothetical protein
MSSPEPIGNAEFALYMVISMFASLAGVYMIKYMILCYDRLAYVPIQDNETNSARMA